MGKEQADQPRDKQSHSGHSEPTTQGAGSSRSRRKPSRRKPMGSGQRRSKAERNSKRGSVGRGRPNRDHVGKHLYAELGSLLSQDVPRVRRTIDAIGEAAISPDKRDTGKINASEASPVEAHTDAVQKAIAAAEQAIADAHTRVAERTAAAPDVSYPDGLPISAVSDEIIETIRDHQVVIIAGETGSGKTTQLPKMCLAAGRGIRGQIAHTQPRRIAARSVAARIAEELGEDIGESVGYSVRFNDTARKDGFIRLMTDGILLAQIQRDRMLWQYDTIIIDEAHERSLNIDFLLGYLKNLLPKRPDLKVIITSATIDVDRFASHFNDAPILQVSGRTFPVEVRYRPLQDLDAPDQPTLDQVEGVVKAVQELCREGAGDILVFFSGEREIRDAHDALNGARSTFQGPPVEIVPLFARLSTADQNRVFAAHTGRRIVLSTNVAETSLTVPGIRYVVDTGTARISRYSTRLKVQRLPIEPVSQASANQRAGRCGRVAEGICIRLFSEEDFTNRPEFTDPEILRTNLASVMLQMLSLGLGDVAQFPFVQPPDSKAIKDGAILLHELHATEPDRRHPGQLKLTTIGRQMSALPIDPRTARMVIAANDLGCLHEVLTIVSALTIQDPRERPTEKRDHADQFHSRFTDRTSDFMAWLNLWNYLSDEKQNHSSSAFRRMCKQEFLHYVRIREWQDLRSQLAQVVKDLGFTITSGRSHADSVHQALLSGLLSQIGLWDERNREYTGTRGAKFAIFPGSGVSKKRPSLIMAAELVETSRLWARDVAAIIPAMVEAQGSHLIKRQYAEPHWSRTKAAVMAKERLTLLGVPVIADRLVAMSSHEPRLCRELFIRHALVQGEWDTKHDFFHRNRALIDDAEQLQSRARRKDLIVDDHELFDFYDERIPDNVVSGRHFDTWWKKHRLNEPKLLNFTEETILKPTAAELDENDFPKTWNHHGIELELSYQFEPGNAADGVTVHIPVHLVNQISLEGFDWQIPGLRADLITAYLRALPKPIRKKLVPIPDMAKLLASHISQPTAQKFTQQLTALIAQHRGVDVEPDHWDACVLPDHLTMTFKVEEDRNVLAESKDLDELKVMTSASVARVVARASSRWEEAGLSAWPEQGVPRRAEDIPDSPETQGIEGFPALVTAADGKSFDLVMMTDAASQHAATRKSVIQLLCTQVGDPASQAAKQLSNRDKLILTTTPYPGPPHVLKALSQAAVMHVVDQHPLPTDKSEFDALAQHAIQQAPPLAANALPALLKCITAAGELTARLPKSASLDIAVSLADLTAARDDLWHDTFITDVGITRLADLVRYFQAAAYRAEHISSRSLDDTTKTRQIQHLMQQWHELQKKLPKSKPIPADVLALRWQFHELRIQLFAQHVRTSHSVSIARVSKALAKLQATYR